MPSEFKKTARLLWLKGNISREQLSRLHLPRKALRSEILEIFRLAGISADDREKLLNAATRDDKNATKTRMRHKLQAIDRKGRKNSYIVQGGLPSLGKGQ
jgi:hypothetical protein